MNRADLLNIWPEGRSAAGRWYAYAQRWARIHWKRSLLVLHFIKMIFWFRDINPFSSFPIATVDYIQFYGRVMRMHTFLQRSGRIWGYDPFDMAGYLSGPFLEVGTHLLAIIAHVLEPFLPISLSMLFIEVGALVAAPFVVFPVMRLLGAKRRTAWVAFGLIIFTFGVCEPFSVGMYKLGLWGFMLSGFLSLLHIALFFRWIERPSLKMWASFTVVSVLLFQLHPAAIVIVVVPLAALYLMNVHRLGWKNHGALAVTSLAVVAGNWYWISPFLAFSHWRVTAPYYTTHGLKDLADRFGPVQQDLFCSIQAIVNDVAAVLALIALRRIALSRPLLARLLAVWIGWLFIVSYFGSFIPWVRTLQPGRNEFVLFNILYLLAATVFESHLLSVRRLRILAALVFPMLLVFMFEKGPGYLPWSKFAPPLRTDLMFWQNELIQYLRTNAPKDGRLLLECADDLNPNFADVVPELTGAILLGGQHPGNFLITRSSLFSGAYSADQYRLSREALAFNHEFDRMTEDEFAAYLSLYNVTMIAARTSSSIGILDRMTHAVELVDTIPPHNIYRVMQDPSWWIAGSGRVAFDYDRITIDDASPGVLILKTHWFDTFKSAPVVPLGKNFMIDDPVPFLLIDNAAGHKHIEIYNGGLPSIPDQILNKLRHQKHPW